jgi:hypothetical protein
MVSIINGFLICLLTSILSVQLLLTKSICFLENYLLYLYFRQHDKTRNSGCAEWHE